MTLLPLDLFGVDFRVGDVIVYATSSSSYVSMNCGTIVDIVEKESYGVDIVKLKVQYKHTSGSLRSIDERRPSYVTEYHRAVIIERADGSTPPRQLPKD